MSLETLLKDHSIHHWLDENDLKTDTGIPLDFKDHQFMWDIYRDMSPKQVIMKAAQVTMSTCATIKSFWVAKNKRMDLIYTLPTESDRNTFVGGKVNRILAQNPILLEWTKDKDSVEQKQVGDNFIHFRGTWTQKAAIMVPSDLNIYDEVDASKQDVIEQYATRLQHSKYRWEWVFSHPSASGYGVDRVWQKSDQKHWLIKCDKGHEQYLSWDKSIDKTKKIFICKKCGIELTDDNRRKGRWARKKGKENAEYSGYWIPLLICPWVSAKQILGYYKDKSEEYFHNKVLGLPYVGGGNKLTWELFAQNLTHEIIAAGEDDRVIIGIDTGLKLDYVMGGQQGLFFHGEAKDYDELDTHMRRWPKAIAIIDAGGDLIGSRKFKERWLGRVFLAYFRQSDKKGEELFTWGKGDEYMTVAVDRERGIQLAVDYFRDRRLPCQGSEDDWYDYWLDWNNLTRIKLEDPQTLRFKGHKWVRSGRDHKALATVLWTAGISRFAEAKSEFIGESPNFGVPVAPYVKPDQTVRAMTPAGQDVVQATMQRLKAEQEGINEGDWRDV